ncbi:oligosaccharide flippase family protein [Niabella aurantiaca]|uniref:oligosaccharide flippase family protein n=1 Tax=Niabella aurantiaca TaxID=379900 RepID=UPI00037DC840|nr:oligosaccharide flippase family protein [Niabella aurantiaca]
MIKKLFNSTGYRAGIIFVCRVISAMLGVFLLPIYIKYLGVESYGLVAFYATISGALIILTMGLSSSINREIAILSARNVHVRKMTSLLYSVEVVNWAVAIASGVLLGLFSNLIAVHWIRADNLNTSIISYSIILMGLLFVFQLPVSVYEGALAGLHRQVEFAFINMFFSVLKSVGVIFILEYVRADIIYYFFWQLIVTFFLAIALRYFAYKFINPERVKKRFSWTQLRRIKDFAIGMTGISVITFFISQIDKIVVSKFLLLKYVGFYNIAFAISGVLMMVASPIHTIVNPKFSALEAQNKEDELKRLYYLTNRWVVLFVVPIGFSLIAFSHDILRLWTKNFELANETSPILKFVALGYVFNCIATTYYFYTLAKGNTKFGLYQNLLSVIVILPLIILLTRRYGAVGAGACWMIYNTLLLSISLPIFHRLYLKGEFLYWIKNIFILPVLVSLILIFGTKLLQEKYFPNLTVSGILIIFPIIFMVYFLVMRETRHVILNVFKRYLFRV